MSDSKKPYNGGAANLNFEVSKLETIALTYPEEMREPFLWLAGYVRNECGCSLDVLEAKTKELKFQTTNSTFSKILRGRWQLDSHNRKITPIMASKNFLQLVERLRAEAQLNTLAGQVAFVKTGTTTLISDYIDVRRAPQRVCKFGFIGGPTGSQKTATFKHYCLLNNHGACIWMEAPERPKLGQFITDLAYRYGASIWLNRLKKENKIRESVNARRTIIVDNIQRLHDEKNSDDQGREVFNYLQKLQDETGCTIILSATAEFYKKFTAGIAKGYYEQFEGRCGGRKQFLVLPEFAPREDVLQIAEAFGLKEPDRHTDYLEKIAQEPGRIRILFQALQSAKQVADNNSEVLTINHVKDAMDEAE